MKFDVQKRSLAIKKARSVVQERKANEHKKALFNSAYDYNALCELDKKLKQDLLDTIFMGNAFNLGCLSHCVSRQVGCVVTKDGRTLVTGVNGSSELTQNCDQLFDRESSNYDPIAHRAWSDVHEIHAEMNAINFAARFGINLDGATMYCSLQPCNECSKNIPAVGFKRIVFAEFYDRVENFEQQKLHLAQKGVIIEKFLSDDDYFERLNGLLNNAQR